MSIRNAMWTIGVLATLALGGCMLDASESGVDEGAVGEESLELGWDGDEGEQPLVVVEDDVVLPGDAEPGDEGDDELSDEEPGLAPASTRLVEEVADPHPDPWMSVVTPEHKD